MSDFSLQVEGVIVPPAVEGEGPLAVIEYVKAAPELPASPAIRAALDADAAQHEARYPARAAAEKAARADRQAREAAVRPAGRGASPIPPAAAPASPES